MDLSPDQTVGSKETVLEVNIAQDEPLVPGTTSILAPWCMWISDDIECCSISCCNFRSTFMERTVRNDQDKPEKALEAAKASGFDTYLSSFKWWYAARMQKCLPRSSKIRQNPTKFGYFELEYDKDVEFFFVVFLKLDVYIYIYICMSLHPSRSLI